MRPLRGQGIVWECLGFSGIRGYNTGGCLHFVINNQIGFTTSPQFARSSPYPSDVAKGVQAPIFHVNGDDPEAVTFACKMAIEYRQTFHRDVVIDMWCYRRNGHNEGDEPSFTQPLMYDRIKSHPPVSEVYGQKLIEQKVIDRAWIDENVKQFTTLLEGEFEAGASYKPNKADWFAGRWSGLHAPADGEASRRNVETGIEQKLFDSLGRTLTTVPDGLTVHKTLNRVLDAKREMFRSGANFDWATGEALAFGSLLSEGYGVRLSGQDSGRGTFSQRHAVWVDQTDEHKYVPLWTVEHGSFEVLDSPLSEYGVLGFEYGYALADPKTLVLWEAQFGDFMNGAQIMIDQFIASGEAKWLRANGLVMLLPHGYEGARSGAFLGPPGTLPAIVRAGQHAGRELHDAGELLSPPAPADASQLPQAVDRVHAEVAAAAQAGGVQGIGLPQRQPLHAHPQRSFCAGRYRRDASRPVHREGRIRPDGSTGCGGRHRYGDRASRAALSLPG